MLDTIIEFLNQFPRGLATVILSTLPISELRLAIPIAIHSWLLRPLDALGLAIVGNLIPLIPLYFGLGWLREMTEKFAPWMTRVIDKSVNRAERRVHDKYVKYGALALFLFTALPLPFTGLWTATLAAVALKIPFRYAIMGIIPGVFTAGIIVTVLSVSADVLF